MKKLMFAAAIALALPVAPALGQDSDTPQRMEDVTWARVVLTKFKPGKRDRAIEIIRDYFAKADGMTGKKSGIHGLHFNTGEWDMVYVFPMEGGPADMTWLNSPDDVAWMAQMVKLAGSKENAMKLIEEYNAAIDSETSFVGHAHKDH